MKPTRVVRAALALASAAGLTLAPALSASAALAAVPGWRLVKTVGPTTSGILMNLAATSATDGWATWVGWDGDAEHQVAHDGVLHWNGTAWRTVPVQSSMQQYLQRTVAIAAPSARNVWLFNEFGDDTKALHWNGSKWGLATLPSWVVRVNGAGEVQVAAPAFSGTNMWVFSMGDIETRNLAIEHFAARYNGHSWSKVTLPLVPFEVSAVSPTDIWALGSSVNLRGPALAHWNGRKWVTVALPKESAPKGAQQYFADLLALGPDNVWTDQDIIQGTAGAVTRHLLHWNGRSWSKVNFRYPTSFVAAPLAPDGHGGLWISAVGPKPFPRHFYHLNDGHWSEYAGRGTPVWIPGTTSMWAWGDASVNPNIVGRIYKYGK